MDFDRRRWCLAAALALAGFGRAGATEATVRLGLMPVYGIRTLMSHYEPVRHYLAQQLKRPVRVETAPDFLRYLNRILAGEFEIAIAAAHFARIAQLDKGWVPLAQFTPDHDTLLIGRADALPKRPSDLAGREVAVIDRLAITVMGGLQYLERQGLESDRDYKVVEYRNHASVVHSLLSGASTLAVTTSHGLRQIPTDLRARVALYKHVTDIPAFVILAAPTLDKASVAMLRDRLQSFPREAEGLEFFAQTGYTGLRLADEAAMRRADPYLKATRRMVGR